MGEKLAFIRYPETAEDDDEDEKDSQKTLGTGLMSLKTPRYSTCPQGAEPSIVVVVVLD